MSETINHYGMVRLRVLGTGNLKMKLLALPDFTDIQTELELATLSMTGISNRMPDTLCNFVSMSAQLEIKTTEIDEIFKIGKIMIFKIPIASSYPS